MRIVGGLHSFDDTRVLSGEVFGFPDVGNCVVELHGFGGDVLFLGIAFPAFPFLPGIEFPFSTPYRARAMHKDVVLMRTPGTGFAGHERPDVLPVDLATGELPTAQLGEGGQKSMTFAPF